jgi:hypothetical protein
MTLILPANLVLSPIPGVIARPQLPADDVAGNGGMVKFDSEIVTLWVLVSYGAVDVRTTCTGIERHCRVNGAWIVTRTENVVMKVTFPVASIDPVAAPGVSWVRKIVSVLPVVVLWYGLRVSVAPVMFPVVALTWPVIDPGGGMLAGGVVCTWNDPAVMASVNDVVLADATLANTLPSTPPNSPATMNVASRPATACRKR